MDAGAEILSEPPVITSVISVTPDEWALCELTSESARIAIVAEALLFTVDMIGLQSPQRETRKPPQLFKATK